MTLKNPLVRQPRLVLLFGFPFGGAAEDEKWGLYFKKGLSKLVVMDGNITAKMNINFLNPIKWNRQFSLHDHFQRSALRLWLPEQS